MKSTNKLNTGTGKIVAKSFLIFLLFFQIIISQYYLVAVLFLNITPYKKSYKSYDSFGRSELYYIVSGKDKIHDEHIDKTKNSPPEVSKQSEETSAGQIVCLANTICRIGFL